MFTGIVEEIGRVASVAAGRMVVSARRVIEALQPGESLAVSGVCLTVVAVDQSTFAADLSEETCRLTNLGLVRPGDSVNLERAMRFSDRIGGHLVSGHVEGIGMIRRRTVVGDVGAGDAGAGDVVEMAIDVPPGILKYCVAKGSIAVDGVSLTINAIDAAGVTVMLIPHTLRVTTLGRRRAFDRVNLESDLIGKYVERLLSSASAGDASAGDAGADDANARGANEGD